MFVLYWEQVLRYFNVFYVNKSLPALQFQMLCQIYLTNVFQREWISRENLNHEGKMFTLEMFYLFYEQEKVFLGEKNLSAVDDLYLVYLLYFFFFFF